MKPTTLLPAGLLALAAVLVLPPMESEGYTLIGDSLSLTQRDFRIYNNFTSPEANDNTTADPNFPGYTGAVQAIWKGCVEWGSGPHGSGNGDPTQLGGIGTGGANFDPTFQGRATSVGGSTDNIHSEISGSNSGVLAYTEGGLFSSAWRIRYYGNWNWDDGPGSTGFGRMDLQGVATHEYGHALGLDHTTVAGSTMTASASGSGTSERSIEFDDIAGVQAVYGVRSASKPLITSTTVSGNQVTIVGSNFSSSGNEIWFTQGNAGGNGTPVKMNGVSSSMNGTRIVVSVPSSAGPGDLLVKKSGSSNSSLSNAWPFDPSGGPGLPVVSTISPSSITVVNVNPVSVALTGSGFSTLISISVDGVLLSAADYTVNGDGSLDFNMPALPRIGTLQVLLTNISGSAAGLISVVANDPPVVSPCCPLVYNGQSVDVTVGAKVGSVALLAISPDNQPSVIPGIVNATIGNNFQTLFLLGSYTIGSQGWVRPTFPIAGIAPFTDLFLQAAVLDTQGTMPLPVSNSAKILVVF